MEEEEEEEEEEINIAPRYTLSAADILTLSPSHHGFLRYEGGLERFVQRSVILKPFFREAAKWRQRFAVLYEGCMYLYPDEYSRSPSKAFPLTGYNSIKRIQGSETNARRQRFMLVPLQSQSKLLKFCSSSDADRKVWFQKIRKEIEFAVSGTSHSRSSPDLDEYVSLEEPIQSATNTAYAKPQTKPKEKQKEEKGKTKKVKDEPKGPKGTAITKPLPPVPDSDEEEEEEEADYDCISDESRPLPELPPAAEATTKPAVDNGRRLVLPIKPSIAPKPTNKKKTFFSRSEFELNSSDRSKVEDILDGTEVGTFLVRKSRQDDQEVLSINTAEGVKEYKIYLKQKGYSIDNKSQWFATTEELLDYYAENDVPNRGLTLSRGFSCSTEESQKL